MADWTDIADLVLDVGKPIRSIDHFALRDNVVAAFEKASGAPVLANNYIVAAMIAADQVTTVKILNANFTAAKLATGTNERDWVLARTAAASVGALGTYGMFRNTGASLSHGQTIAGSSLLYSNATATSVGTNPSGTWMCCGRSDTSSTADESVSLFLRVA